MVSQEKVLHTATITSIEWNFFLWHMVAWCCKSIRIEHILKKHSKSNPSAQIQYDHVKPEKIQIERTKSK